MAQLSADDRRTIQRWTGTLPAAELVDVGNRVETLGNPLVVAYEILSTRLADMLASPDELRIEGDARVRWVEAKKQLQAQIDRLLAALRTIDDLNSAATAVLASDLASAGGSVITARPYTAFNPRP